MPNDSVIWSSPGRIPGTGGGGVDELAKVSSTDTLADYLQEKLSAGTGITFSIVNPGGDEQLQITSDSTVTANDEDIVVPIDFNSAATILVRSITEDATVTKVRVAIDTPFDDAGVTIQAGTASDNGLFHMTNENEPTVEGSYETWADSEILSGTDINLYIDTASSTAGEGKVIFTLSR